jgi:micrococcal nuclease
VKSLRTRSPVLLLMLLAFALGACGPDAPIVAPGGSDSESGWPEEIVFDLQAISELTEAQVVGVTDGDTIDVRIEGRNYDLRYIGINTPEINHPTKGLEPFGPEATEANRRLVEGQTVYLEGDVSGKDRYGRLLRYVYLPDGLMINAALVWQGYAHAVSYPPDVKHQSLLRQMQHDAQSNDRGLWGSPP